LSDRREGAHVPVEMEFLAHFLGDRQNAYFLFSIEG
jgi:hypothetical protein